MSERFERRREALRAAWKNASVEADALLVTHEPNVAYLTGFTGDSSVLLLTRNSALIISDFRYEAQLEQECPGLDAHIRPIGTVLDKEIGSILKKRGLGRVAFEEKALTVAELRTLDDEADTTTFVPTSDLVEGIRAIKDESEIAEIRRAVAIAEAAYRRLLEQITPEQDEKQVADALEFELRGGGALCSSFPPIVAAGARSALPHARPQAGERLAEAEFVLFDWGASVGPLGYKSDLTRLWSPSKVSPTFESVYRVVFEAQRRAIAAIRPGVAASKVDAAARSVIEEAGYGDRFGHGLGHGVGLEIHEGPRIRPNAEETLQAGMVVTIEPGVYLPGWGGIRLEDDVLITPDGAETLSSLPNDLDAS